MFSWWLGIGVRPRSFLSIVFKYAWYENDFWSWKRSASGLEFFWLGKTFYSKFLYRWISVLFDFFDSDVFIFQLFPSFAGVSFIFTVSFKIYAVVGVGMDGGSWGALKEIKICVGGNHWDEKSYIMVLGTKALSNSTFN